MRLNSRRRFFCNLLSKKSQNSNSSRTKEVKIVDASTVQVGTVSMITNSVFKPVKDIEHPFFILNANTKCNTLKSV